MIGGFEGGAMSILVRRASKADAEAISRLNADVQAVHAAASSGVTASRPIRRGCGIASRLARPVLPCYSRPMQRLTSPSPGDAGPVSAVSRQRELLILCARIGFNP